MDFYNLLSALIIKLFHLTLYSKRAAFGISAEGSEMQDRGSESEENGWSLESRPTSQ